MNRLAILAGLTVALFLAGCFSQEARRFGAPDSVESLALSPDGSVAVFARGDGQAVQSLHLYNSSTKIVSPLLEWPGADLTDSAFVDNQTLLFVATNYTAESSSSNIHAVNLQTMTTRWVHGPVPGMGNLVVSANGESVYYLSNRCCVRGFVTGGFSGSVHALNLANGKSTTITAAAYDIDGLASINETSVWFSAAWNKGGPDARLYTVNPQSLAFEAVPVPDQATAAEAPCKTQATGRIGLAIYNATADERQHSYGVVLDAGHIVARVHAPPGTFDIFKICPGAHGTIFAIAGKFGSLEPKSLWMWSSPGAIPEKIA